VKEENLAELDHGRGMTKIFLTRREVITNNFLGGCAWGLGSVLGATIVVGIVFWLLGQLGALPIIGESITNTINQSIENIDTSPLQNQLNRR
jgi:hypothetical protein